MAFPDRGTFLENGLTFLSPYGLPADQTQCFICFNSYMPDDRSMDSSTKAAFELPEAPVRLPCGHVFGLDCIRRWTDPEQGKSNTCAMCRSKLFDLPPQRTAREMLTAVQDFLNGTPLPQDAPHMVRGDDGFLVITRSSAESGEREITSVDIPASYFLDNAGGSVDREIDLVDLVNAAPEALLDFLQEVEEEEVDEDLDAALRAWDMQSSLTNQQIMDSDTPTMLSPPIDILNAGPFAHRPPISRELDQVPAVPQETGTVSIIPPLSPSQVTRNGNDVEPRIPSPLNGTRRDWSPTAPCGFGTDSDSDSDSDSSVEDELEQEIELAGFEFENLVERHGEWVVSGFDEELEDVQDSVE